ncbi:MAG: amidohydrolase family protein [Catenulispora sp.]|nr:amidohydrolase family protein [Catenulispora sp.]
MTDEHQDPVSPGRRRAATVLDSHVHFWDTRGSISYPWLSEVPPLDRPFTPEDFDALRPADTEAIFVEAGRAEEHAAAEIDWVREQARRHPWILGAVAHVRLEDPDTARTAISSYAADPFVVGVRRNLQDEPPGFLEDPGLRAGVRLLGEAGLPFDACVREQQLPELVELAAACPGTTIVLDHLGKPKSAAKRRPWWQVLRRLADHDNVVVKLSGLATEIPVNTPRTLVAVLLQEALDAFGAERCLYGGDWPVMTLATSYGDWLGLVRTALADRPAATADAVLAGNARRVYGIRTVPSP